ncbi:hypothetical protein [Neorhodopirellula lusitana]|uniref:hypothetical protein n=1 Tax=Neorhodopirellula lusitana TaxID=445327 RepID=UPI00384D1E18
MAINITWPLGPAGTAPNPWARDVLSEEPPLGDELLGDWLLEERLLRDWLRADFRFKIPGKHHADHAQDHRSTASHDNSDKPHPTIQSQAGGDNHRSIAMPTNAAAAIKVSG